MLDKRLEQAKTVDTIRQQYMDAYGYKEYQMEQLDPDVLSDDLMIAINEMLYGTGIDKTGEDAYWHEAGFSSYDEFIEAQMEADEQGGEELLKSSKANTELQSEVDKLKTQVDKDSLLIFANGNISKSFLVNPAGQIIGLVNTDHTFLRRVFNSPLLIGRYARLTHFHHLNFRTRKLLCSLQKIPAVHPACCLISGNNHRSGRAGKSADIRSCFPVTAYILTLMRVGR